MMQLQATPALFRSSISRCRREFKSMCLFTNNELCTIKLQTLPPVQVQTDPEAAKVVFEAGVPLVMIPLEVGFCCRAKP